MNGITHVFAGIPTAELASALPLPEGNRATFGQVPATVD